MEAAVVYFGFSSLHTQNAVKRLRDRACREYTHTRTLFKANAISYSLRAVYNMIQEEARSNKARRLQTKRITTTTRTKEQSASYKLHLDGFSMEMFDVSFVCVVHRQWMHRWIDGTQYRC